jgi:hypothetical protein
VGHASRSSDLLHVEASRASVFQFGSKLVEVRRWVVHVGLLFCLWSELEGRYQAFVW